MRLGRKTDKEAIAENILKLTGRSLFTIDRKNKSFWTGILQTKLWLVSNDRPALSDTSGALASRFIIFRSRVSFNGREQPHFFRDKLAPEIPAIVNWAIAGLRRMLRRGALAEPASGAIERELLTQEGSPVLAFIADRMMLDPLAQMPKGELLTAYNVWARGAGHSTVDERTFFRDLKTAVGDDVRASRPTGEDGKRHHVMLGIRPKAEGER
jgi:putative DNA primase/helicase